MVLDNGQMGIYSGEEYIALGIDPGREKTGFAFVDMEGNLLLSGIIPTLERENLFSDLTRYVIEGDISSLPECVMSKLKFIAIGDGTSSREFSDWLKSIAPCEVLTVDEKNTTLEARGLYWRIHRPGFWARLLPEGIRVPGRVLDDLAAWAVALRGLKKYRDISRNKL